MRDTSHPQSGNAHNQQYAQSKFPTLHLQKYEDFRNCIKNQIIKKMKRLLFYSAILLGMMSTFSCSKNDQISDSNGMAELHQFAQRCRNHPETMIAPLCHADSVLYYIDVYSHLYEGHIYKTSCSSQEGYVNISMVTDSNVIKTFYSRLSAYENGAKEVDVIKTTDSVEFSNWYNKHLKNGDDIYVHFDPKTGIYYGEACPHEGDKGDGKKNDE